MRQATLLVAFALVACCGSDTARDASDGDDTVADTVLADTDPADTVLDTGPGDTGPGDAADTGDTAPAPVDECALGLDDCGAHTTCADTPDGFRCDCDAGYVAAGDGRACVDADECAGEGGGFDCGPGGLCENTDGGYACRCGVGYTTTATGCACRQEPLFRSIADVSHLAAGDDGLYLLDRLARVVWRVDASGARHIVLDAAGSSGRFEHPQSLAVARDGTVVVSDPELDEVRVLRPGDGQVWETVRDDDAWDGSSETGQLGDVAITGTGYLFVLDVRDQEIRYKPSAGYWSTIPIAWDPRGLFVSDYGIYATRYNGSVREAVVYGSGDGWVPLTDAAGSTGDFAYTVGIAAADDGTVYVADWVTSDGVAGIVHVLRPDGVWQPLVDSDLDQKLFDRITAMTVTRDGTVFVADEVGLYALPVGGRWGLVVDDLGLSLGRTSVAGVTVRSDGAPCFAHYELGGVACETPGGRFAQVSDLHLAAGRLRGLAAGDDGDLYTLDDNDAQSVVLHVGADGAAAPVTDSQGSTGAWSGPRAVARAGDGTLYVGDTRYAIPAGSSNLVALAPGGAWSAVVGADGLGVERPVTSIAAGPDGSLYVAADYLLRLAPGGSWERVRDAADFTSPATSVVVGDDGTVYVGVALEDVFFTSVLYAVRRLRPGGAWELVARGPGARHLALSPDGTALYAGDSAHGVELLSVPGDAVGCALPTGAQCIADEQCATGLCVGLYHHNAPDIGAGLGRCGECAYRTTRCDGATVDRCDLDLGWHPQADCSAGCVERAGRHGCEDGDGVPIRRDNCPFTSNPDQADADDNGVGDACDDEDDDDDGIPDPNDPCPRDAENDPDDDGICGDLDRCPHVGLWGGEEPHLIFASDVEQARGTGRTLRGIARRTAALSPRLAWRRADPVRPGSRHLHLPAQDGDAPLIRPEGVPNGPRAALTFSIMIRGGSLPNPCRFLSSFDGAGGVAPDELVFDHHQGHLRFLVGGASAISTAEFTASSAWQQVGVVFDRGRVRFYANGAPLGEDRPFGATELPAQARDLVLFGDAVPVNPNLFPHDADVDEIVIYRRAFDDAEMRRLYDDGLHAVVTDQLDEDGDGLGAACDPCPFDATNLDPDGDGICTIGAGACDGAGEEGLVAMWPFTLSSSLRDVVGGFDAVDLRGARHVAGQLDLDVGGWARAGGYGGPELTAKTLVAWVRLEDLAPGGDATPGGAALTVDRVGTDVFDGIVFAGAEAGAWEAGSDGGARTTPADPGYRETATGALVQVAIAYAPAGADAVEVTLCRDGQRIGQSLESPLATFPAGDAEAVFGARYAAVDGSAPGGLDALVEEARIYDRALTCAEVGALVACGAPTAGDNCPDTPNIFQDDTDGDGVGDACEPDAAP